MTDTPFMVVHIRILALVFAAGALTCAALFLLLLAAQLHGHP